jgi:hypothetical protein
MKKITNIPICILIIFTLFLAWANGIFHPFNIPSLFIIGKWTGEYVSRDGYEIQNDLQFMPFNILLLGTRTGEGKVQKIYLSYRFIGKDYVTINGRLVDEFQFKRDGEDLLINSKYGIPAEGRYKRVISAWEWIEVLSFAIIGSILIRIWSKKSY